MKTLSRSSRGAVYLPTMFRESLEPTSRMLRDYGFARRRVKRSGLHPVKFGRRSQRNECRSPKIECYERPRFHLTIILHDIATSERGKTNNGGCRATLLQTKVRPDCRDVSSRRSRDEIFIDRERGKKRKKDSLQNKSRCILHRHCSQV